ncbi:MAG: hypothetical protein EOQ33_24145 [Mesorhizobium sp.]|nr:MAG: hypothetical protein EOQ33_24145 [Mesorhizobium sp.]TIN06568.1 MAG: hypothetical protein E5Y14_28265 [Mesorhizobium sp.]
MITPMIERFMATDRRGGTGNPAGI